MKLTKVEILGLVSQPKSLENDGDLPSVGSTTVRVKSELRRRHGECENYYCRGERGCDGVMRVESAGLSRGVTVYMDTRLNVAVEPALAY